MTTYYLSVPGAQLTKPERNFIFSRAVEVEGTLGKDITNVMIGVFWGASLWCMREGSPNSHLVGVDIDLRRTRTNPTDRIWHEDELYNTDLVEAESTSYGKIFQLPIALLVIDGDHHYVQVYDDIRAWVPHVQKDGFVIFHDYTPTDLNMQQFPELEGVHRAVDEYFNGNTDWERVKGPDSIVAFRRLK